MYIPSFLFLSSPLLILAGVYPQPSQAELSGRSAEPEAHASMNIAHILAPSNTNQRREAFPGENGSPFPKLSTNCNRGLSTSGCGVVRTNEGIKNPKGDPLLSPGFGLTQRRDAGPLLQGPSGISTVPVIGERIHRPPLAGFRPFNVGNQRRAAFLGGNSAKCGRGLSARQCGVQTNRINTMGKPKGGSPISMHNQKPVASFKLPPIP